MHMGFPPAGVRLYTHGASFEAHIDRVETHIASVSPCPCHCGSHRPWLSLQSM